MKKKAEVPHELLAVQLFRIGIVAALKAAPGFSTVSWKKLGPGNRAGMLAIAKHVFENYDLKRKDVVK